MVVVVTGRAREVLRDTRLDVLRVGEPSLPQHVLEGAEPVLVVRVRLVRRVRCIPAPDPGDQMPAELLPLDGPRVVQGDDEPEGAALPGLLEDELPVAARQRRLAAERLLERGVRRRRSGHAAQAATPVGAPTTATPIMASRVTSAASSSSLIPSVPGGRCGSTKYRSSAVTS